MFFFNDIQPIGNNTENSFDSIKQIDANGNEFCMHEIYKLF